MTRASTVPDPAPHQEVNLSNLSEIKRCAWAGGSGLMAAYHDAEWGTPLHDERGLFEFVILEGAQAGLSWNTILNKREAYRTAFDGFDPKVVANYAPEKINMLLANAGIVRNRRKIESAVANARAFLLVQAEFGSFDAYVWKFVGGKCVHNNIRELSEIPTQTTVSEALSKDLLKRGFRFVGPTICYAFMQAVGMVNDHVLDCFRYAELTGAGG
jgi:DNA-3-methyladenine glycosylase I